MDLYGEYKALDPQASDDEINQGITTLQTQFPHLDDVSLLSKAKELHAQYTQSQPAQPIAAPMDNTTTPVAPVASPMNLNNPVTDPTAKTQEGMLASYSPDARKAAQDKADSVNNSTRNKIGNALTIFAEGFKKNPDIAGAIANNQAYDKSIDEKYVGNFDKAKANAVQDYNLGRTVKADERTDKTFNREDQLKTQNADPKSAISVSKRTNAMKLDPKNAKQYANMSGEEIDQVQKNLETNYKIDQDNLTRRDKLASDAATRAATKTEKGDKATSDKQFRSFTTLSTQLAGTRGGDPASKQAELDIYNANKVDDLINLYGDPNKLSPAQVAIATSEIAKIAKGGVPDSQEWKAIDPSTFKGAAAKAWSKVINEPTEANAGAFLKQYADYGGALRKNAEKTIENSYGRKIESFKQRLDPQDYQALQDEYINRFKKYPSNNQASAPASPKTPQVGSVEDGHKFLGGDPSKPESWAAVQ